MIVYRLGSARYPANDGSGASRYGGRWNHKGTPVTYTSASRALCALEVLANADELVADYVVTQIELPDDLPVTTRSIETLPPSWDAGEPADLTRDIGTEWAKRRLNEWRRPSVTNMGESQRCFG
jgi:RES domain-containing protein